MRVKKKNLIPKELENKLSFKFQFLVKKEDSESSTEIKNTIPNLFYKTIETNAVDNYRRTSKLIE